MRVFTVVSRSGPYLKKHPISDGDKMPIAKSSNQLVTDVMAPAITYSIRQVRACINEAYIDGGFFTWVEKCAPPNTREQQMAWWKQSG
jgi:hypothetical protein